MIFPNIPCLIFHQRQIPYSGILKICISSSGLLITDQNGEHSFKKIFFVKKGNAMSRTVIKRASRQYRLFRKASEQA